MPKFADCLGREWTLRLTLGHRSALKDLGVDVKDLATALATLTTATGIDVGALVSVCHLLTVETATRDEFERGWDAETVERAGEALADAVADFFLSRRPQLATALKQKVKAELDKLDRQAAEKLSMSSDSATS